MQPLLQELHSRWQGMFAALARGEDLPPGRRLRAEGLAEAAVLTGAASEESLDQDMDRYFREAFGISLGECLEEDWRDFFPFPEIPAVARRAPVYPSTAD
ncbi:MAG: hypothetical protein V7720_12010 [Halioglobus sp.]